MSQKYSLEIISHHKDFSNKAMRQYHVDGINTIGVYGDEPFEVRFRNHTGFKVQVKLSLDGTDLLSGEKANTEVSKDMWVVQPYATLNLKAWPESQNGGAALIFTSANNSVAVHTHGDLSSRGIIAAAVFEEGHVSPQPVIERHYHHYDYWWNKPIWVGTYGYSGSLGQSGQSVICNSIATNGSASLSAAGTATMDCIQSSNNVLYNSSNSAEESSTELQSLASVGAGQYTEQKISYVAGLTKPIFTETVRVRYLWWDDLQTKLRTISYDAPHGSGFPGDKPVGINLGNTPRLGYTGNAFPKQTVPTYLRF